MKIGKNYLSKEDFKSIHNTTVRILENVGVALFDDAAVECFKRHGAKTDGKTVFISESMLNDALKTVPRSFKIYNRHNQFLTVGDGNVIYAPNGGSTMIKRGNAYRNSFFEDYIYFQMLISSSNVLDMSAPWILDVFDVPQSLSREMQMIAALSYNEKPVAGWTTSEKDAEMSISTISNFYDITDIYKPVTIGVINSISPLKYDYDSLRAINTYAKNNQPLVITSCSIPGATSPITTNGTLVLNNAEILAGIVYTQLLQPGLGVVYGNTSGGTDMRYMSPASASPEAARIALASSSLAEWYGFPSRAGGQLTDSKLCDYQAGAESTMLMMSAVFTNVSWIMQSCGILDSFKTLCYEKFILDEQNLEIIKKVRQDNSIEPSLKDYDEIVENTKKGNFLESEQSLKSFRCYQYSPYIYQTAPYNIWAKKSGITAIEKAASLLERRLLEFEMPDLTASQRKYLKKYGIDAAACPCPKAVSKVIFKEI